MQGWLVVRQAGVESHLGLLCFMIPRCPILNKRLLGCSTRSQRRIMDELKKEISNILGRALAGYKDDYKIHHTDGHTYIAWGAVERDMHTAVDSAFAAAQPNNANQRDGSTAVQ